MDRRHFLKGAGLALGGGVLPFTAARAGESPAPKPPSAESSWQEVRDLFDADPRLAHMAGFFLSTHPRPVREAIERHRRGLDADPYGYFEGNVRDQEVALRAAVADYFEVAADGLAVTDSTTMGLGLVYGGLQLREGQEVLSTTHDHVATFGALRYMTQRTGASLRQVPLYDDPAAADADRIVETFARALRPETRVVALTWVHSGTGVKLPIRRLADALARANAERDEADRAFLFVDGVHGFGVDDVTAGSLGCDGFVAGTHKWIFGPRGTGMAWATPEAWALSVPTIVTFDPIWRRGDPRQMPPAAYMTPGGFQPYEHRWAATEAFRLHLALGKARVAERIHALNRMCKEGMAEIPGVRVVTPMADELSAGIICFEVEGMGPSEVVERLHRKTVVASVTPGFYERLYPRLSPGLLTLEDDVERALAAVRAL